MSIGDRSGLIERACENCGASVRRTPGNFKKHVFCNAACYWASGFQRKRLAANNPNPRPNHLTCTGCGIRFKRPPNKQYEGKSNFHSRECMAEHRRHTAEPSETCYGYLDIYVGHDYPGAGKSGRIMLHRKIMQEHLGRPLMKHENVHHKNGDRKDNRLSNLELWSTSQPTGQRVEDKLKWAREFLRMYEGVNVDTD